MRPQSILYLLVPFLDSILAAPSKSYHQCSPFDQVFRLPPVRDPVGTVSNPCWKPWRKAWNKGNFKLTWSSNPAYLYITKNYEVDWSLRPGSHWPGPLSDLSTFNKNASGSLVITAYAIDTPVKGQTLMYDSVIVNKYANQYMPLAWGCDEAGHKWIFDYETAIPSIGFIADVHILSETWEGPTRETIKYIKELVKKSRDTELKGLMKVFAKAPQDASRVGQPQPWPCDAVCMENK